MYIRSQQWIDTPFASAITETNSLLTAILQWNSLPTAILQWNELFTICGQEYSIATQVGHGQG